MNSTRNLLIILWSILLHNIACSQITDSTDLANLNEEISTYIDQKKIQDAIEKGLYAAEYIEKLKDKYPEICGQSYYYLGFSYLLNYDFTNGKKYLSLAADLWKSTLPTPFHKLKGACHTYLGIIAQYNEEWNTALNHYEHALTYVSTDIPYEWETMNLHNLALLYKEIEDFEGAQTSYLQGLSTNRKRMLAYHAYSDSLQYVETLNAISSLYIDGDALDSARSYLDLINEFLNPFSNKAVEAIYYTNEGRFYEKKGFLNVDKSFHQTALTYHKKALRLRQEEKDFSGTFNSWINIGANYEYLQNYQEAISAYTQGEKLLEYVEAQDSAKIYLNLSDAYAQQENDSLAQKYRERCYTLSRDQRTIKNVLDYNREKVSHISNLHIKKEEMEYQLALTYILAFFGMLTLGLGTVNIYQKKKSTELKLENANRKIEEIFEEVNSNMLSNLNEAKEDTLRKVSRELHDHIGAGLASSVRELKTYIPKLSGSTISVDRFSILCEELNGYYELVRKMSHYMGNLYLAKGLYPSLLEFKDTLSNRGLFFELYTHRMKGVRFGEEIEINVFRIVQEALENAYKYAEAQNIEVQLAFQPPKTGLDDGLLTLTIEDDGKGFDMHTYSEGLGIINMRERTEAIRGRFIIDSQPNRGCTIISEIPIPTYKKDS